MKIALVKPPATYADYDRRPLFGICYISAVLKSIGFDCRIFDAHFNLWSQKDTVNKVLEYKPDIIGFTAMTHEIAACAQMASMVKKSLHVPVLIGGCHITALPEKTLKEFPDFDYGVYGEGEKTIIQLVEFLQQSVAKEPSDIQGLVFRDSGGNIRVNEAREPLTSAELDPLPYPDLQDYYHDDKALASKNSYYPMFTSRGCCFHCAFCMQVLGRKIRHRSAENIVKEMEFAIAQYGAHTFNFSDEIFLFNDQRTRELLQLFIDTSLAKRVRWSGLVRANLVTPELISLAKRAGCYRLEMGVESGDDQILKAINKGITVQQIKDATKIIKRAGISLGTYFILGHPNETRETIKKTIRLAADLNTNTISVGLMVPYPGTKIYEMAQRSEGGYRLLTTDWAEYDKYGGKALEVGNLSFKELSNFQRQAFLTFYVNNFRLLDLVKFLFKYRRGMLFLLKKMVNAG